MKKNIFHSASIKLAAMYMLAIMVVSIIFTFWLYNISISEITNSVLRAPGPIEQILRKENSRFAKELKEVQDGAIEDARENLIYQFVVLNIVIAFGGALGGYYLARRTLQPIEDAHEAQAQFTADASHELRTPITAMRAETELTLTEPKLTLKNAKKQLESNIEELDKLTNLSGELLELARLDSKPLSPTPTSTDDIINDAINKVKPLAESKKQLFNVSGEIDITIIADKENIVKSLVILLENAVKYSSDNSEIQIATKSQFKTVEISVTDSGSGIKAVDLPHIFDRFYRGDQSRNKDKINGFGLGLSLAKAIVTAHDGNISVKSTPSKGSTFTISLPVN